MGTARDIALVFLALQALVAALVPLALVVALVYGMFRVIPAVRRLLLRGQEIALRAHELVEDVSCKTVSPLISLHVSVTRVASMARTLTSGRRSRR